MERFEQLVEALRSKFIAYDVTGNHNSAQLYKDAAAAIEALQKDLTTLQTCYEIADATVDAVLKLLPKRGEWVGVSPTVDTVQCSICGGQLFSAELETPYCPYCGAKMREVQE